MPDKTDQPPAVDRDRLKHRRIMRRLLLNDDIRDIARQEKVTQKHIRHLIRQLRDVGWDPGKEWVTTVQAALMLNVRPRRVRTLCDEGRMGRQFAGKIWLISQEELLQYLGREHLTGAAGRELAQWERPAAEPEEIGT